MSWSLQDLVLIFIAKPSTRVLVQKLSILFPLPFQKKKDYSYSLLEIGIYLASHVFIMWLDSKISSFLFSVLNVARKMSCFSLPDCAGVNNVISSVENGESVVLNETLP